MVKNRLIACLFCCVPRVPLQSLPRASGSPILAFCQSNTIVNLELLDTPYARPPDVEAEDSNGTEARAARQTRGTRSASERMGQ